MVERDNHNKTMSLSLSTPLLAYPHIQIFTSILSKSLYLDHTRPDPGPLLCYQDCCKALLTPALAPSSLPATLQLPRPWQNQTTSPPCLKPLNDAPPLLGGSPKPLRWATQPCMVWPQAHLITTPLGLSIPTSLALFQSI